MGKHAGLMAPRQIFLTAFEMRPAKVYNPHGSAPNLLDRV
jgi:hypothetical protein